MYIVGKDFAVNLFSRIKLIDKKILFTGLFTFFIFGGTTSYVIVMNQNAKKITPEVSEISDMELEELLAKKEAEEAVEEGSETEETVVEESATDTPSGTGTGSGGSSGGGGSTPPSDPEDPGWVWDETPPVLVNTMVNFAPYDSETGKAGDFIFDVALDKVFGDFGWEVSGPGGPKILPTWDFLVTLDTPVYAPTGGEVVMFTYQASTNDYEILLRPVFNSVWLINYDHLRNVPAGIVEGAQITAGQYIGTPGPWFSNGIVELMITRDLGAGAVGYCPYDFMTPSLKTTFTSNVNTIMSEWETFKSDTGIYNEAGHIKPGCLYNTTPA